MNSLLWIKQRESRRKYQETGSFGSPCSLNIFVSILIIYLALQITEFSVDFGEHVRFWPEKAVALSIFSIGAVFFALMNRKNCAAIVNKVLCADVTWRCILTEIIGGIYVCVFVFSESRAIISSNNTFLPDVSKGMTYGIFIVCIAYVAQGWFFRSFFISVPLIFFGAEAAARNTDHYSTAITSVLCAVLFLLVSYLQERFHKASYLKSNKELEFWKGSLNKLNEGILILSECSKASFINVPCKKILSKYGSDSSLNEEITIDNLNRFRELEIIDSMDSQMIPRLQEMPAPYSLASYLQEIYQRLTHNTPRARFSGDHEWISDTLVTLESSTRTIDSEIVHYQIKISSFRSEGKILLLLVFSDITHSKAIASLQKKFEYNSKVLDTVTHEMRTPLNGSLNFLQSALEDDRTPAEIKLKTLIPAKRSNLLLLSLVNDILDFSRLKVDKLKFNFERKNLLETLKEAIELIEIQAKKKGIKVNLIQKEIGAPDFCTDHQRLKQIVLNLLSNSVKFTQKGSVIISLEQLEYSENTQQVKRERVVQISVTDTGVGISEEDQKSLFQEYSQVGGDSQQRKLNPHGVGLGLTIANTLARLLGPASGFKNNSAIKINSQVNQGSTFSFLIEEKQNSELEMSNSVVDQVSESSIRLQDSSILSFRHSEESPMLIPASSVIKPSQFLRKYCAKPRNILGEVYNPDEKSLAIDTVSVGSEGEARRLSGYNFNASPKIQSQKKYKYLKNLITDSHSGITMERTCDCKKVLVVDDDSFNIIASEMMFSALRVQIDTAFNGKEAIEKIVERNSQKNMCASCKKGYSIVFMDITMPVMDGNEATTELRQMMKQGTIESVPIIACSALSQSENKSAQFDDECVKPFSKERVVELLNKYGFNLRISTNLTLPADLRCSV